MKNYDELIKELRQLKGFTICRKKGGNFITDDVQGFIPLTNGYEVEISTGHFMKNWCIGFTLFKDGVLLRDSIDQQYNKCFFDNEIDQIDNYCTDIINYILENNNINLSIVATKTIDNEFIKLGISKTNIAKIKNKLCKNAGYRERDILDHFSHAKIDGNIIYIYDVNGYSFGVDYRQGQTLGNICN